MEFYEISKLLNDSTLSKFVTKKQIEVNDLSSGQYFVNKNIRFKRLMIRSDLCDYSNANIDVKETIDFSANAANKNDKAEKDVAFTNNAPYR